MEQQYHFAAVEYLRVVVLHVLVVQQPHHLS